jgi:solute carrier family 25 citrate transporter 1
MFAQEGFSAFWKGITPRVARVAPGQAVVFTIYEKVKGVIEAAKHGDYTLADTRSDE